MTLTETAMVASLSTRCRLAPGYHLVPTDEGWLLYRPDGLFARIGVKPELCAAAADLLAGEEARPGSVLPDELETFFEALLAEGVVVAIDAPSSPEGVDDGEEVDAGIGTVRRRRVTVEGTGPIAHRLAELLLAADLEPQLVSLEPQLVSRVGAAPAADLLAALSPDDRLPGVVVCCAGWLPDAHFAARDAWCAEHGVAWHGVYREGHRFHLGPFWLPDDPRTVRYADARARRLAADTHPRGLEAYWRYLDAGRGVPTPQPPSPAEAALVAGALAADLSAWVEGQEPPSHGYQLAFDRTSGEWRRHPVLPVPRGLMTEAIP
jgi:hypothetical protein